MKKISGIFAIILILGTLPLHSSNRNPNPLIPAAANNNGNDERIDVEAIIKNGILAATVISVACGTYRIIYQEHEEYGIESLESAQGIMGKTGVITRNGARVLFGPDYAHILWGAPTIKPPQARSAKDPSRGLYGYLKSLSQTQNPDTPKDTESAA